MMNNIILKASAGTGKTYRLSLEFIANLVRGVNYKNIVVMTFTKKERRRPSRNWHHCFAAGKEKKQEARSRQIRSRLRSWPA